MPRTRQHERDDHHGDDPDGEDHRRAPAPDEPGDERGTGHQREEARLREREDEPDPDADDRERRGDHDAFRRSEQREHEQRQHRDDQEPAVDRRVPEDGVDAIERRVRVPDDDLRVPEHVPRGPLPDADRRERQRHQSELGDEAFQEAARPGQPREQDGEQAERQVEEQELDRALVEVVRPREGQAAPADEESQRQRERAELAAPGVPADQLVGEDERRGRDDAVERDQQGRLRRAERDRDPRGNAGERGQRQEPRPAVEEERSDDDRDHSRGGGGGQKLRVAARREVDRQERAADRQGGQARKPAVAPRGDEDRCEPGGAEDSARACELGRHRTNTSARSEWLVVETVRT